MNAGFNINWRLIILYYYLGDTITLNNIPQATPFIKKLSKAFMEPYMTTMDLTTHATKCFCSGDMH